MVNGEVVDEWKSCFCLAGGVGATCWIDEGRKQDCRGRETGVIREGAVLVSV
jgi:hypothetical protein